MFIFSVNVLTTTDRGVVGGVITLLFLFGPASASFTYCLSFLFSSPSICNLVVIISGFLIGLGGSLACLILLLIGADPTNPRENLVNASKALEWILRFIPAFNLAKGLLYVINIDTIQFFAGKPLTAWSGDVLLFEVIFCGWESLVYLYLAMKIDEWSSNPRAVSLWQSFVRIITFQFLCAGGKYSDDNEINVAVPDDDDVIAEQDRVLSGGANDDLIVLSKLTNDNGKVAVNNLSFGIPPGECFGLLGINGAGKAFDFVWSYLSDNLMC